jgi:hypothetical protein
MTKKAEHSPNSPNTLAQETGRLTGTHSPRPFYKKGGRVSVCPCGKACECKNKKPGEWIPVLYQLPKTLDAIEAGRLAEQQSMFDEQPDDSREGRLARIGRTKHHLSGGAVD